MPKHDSPYVVGDYWLDKRRDGKAADVWQIASGTRQVRYRSTGKRSLDDAKAAIHAYVEAERARKPQAPEDARVIPLLLAYWMEKGRHVIAPGQIASSLRAFMGFLFQDEAGMNAVVTDMTPALFDRFRRWRMGPHDYDVPWGGKSYRHDSQGVKGESVQRNLDDVRAALNFAEANGRVAAPKVPSVEGRYRSKPRDRVLTIAELGRIAWYARHFDDLGRYVALLIGTAGRPIALAKFQPSQYDAATGLIDLHPAGDTMTDKRNPTVPAIRPLRLILSRWQGSEPVLTHKTAWRTMRRVLGLSDDVVTKTIRHTVATMLYSSGAPQHEVAALLGHTPNINRTSQRYIHLRPEHMAEAARALSMIWLAVQREANAYGAVHLLSMPSKNHSMRIDIKGAICADNIVFCDGGR